MGLLDQFSEILSTPGGQGLLAAGLGALGGRTVAGGISRGGLLGLQTYANAKDSLAQQERQKMLDTRSGLLFDAQMGQFNAQQESMRKQAEQQQMQQNYIGSIGQVTSPKIGAQPNVFNPMKALSLNMSPEMVKAVAEAPNLGRAKVARTMEGVDANGNKTTFQYDEFGQRVGDGVQAYIEPKMVDLGGRVTFVQPQAGVNLTKTMTPDGIASNAVARGNLAVSQARLALEKSQAQQGKPEFRDGQWVVPPKDMKPGEARAVSPGASARDANEALALIGQARELLPKATGSYGGMAMDQAARVFGKATPGAMATAQLQAVEGALVSKMPKMSGPQSDKDVALYKQMAGVVGDPTVPVEQRQAALDTIEQIQRRYVGQASGQPIQPASGPKQGQVVDGYIYRGGDPSDPHSWTKAK